VNAENLFKQKGKRERGGGGEFNQREG